MEAATQGFDTTERQDAPLTFRHALCGGVTPMPALAQVALDECEVGSRALVDLVPNLLWRNDAAGSVEWFNRRWTELTGQPLQEALGTGWVNMIHPADRARVRALWRQAVNSAQPYVNEQRIRRHDGQYCWHLVRAEPLCDAGGRIVCWFGSATELHEPRRSGGTPGCPQPERHPLEEALRQRTVQAESASHAKSAFLATMSHEFRTPLNAVIGLSQLLEQMALPERALSFVRHIAQAGQQLLGLTNDVLDLSRIEAGEMRLEHVPFALVPLLEAVQAIVHPQAVAKGLTLHMEFSPALPAQLYGDPLRLKQILLNLLGNAIKFTRAGRVKLRLRQVGRHPGLIMLRIEVRDTGIGIPAEAQARIFDPFAQAEGSTARRFGGSGLGLSIVRRLVDLMGGELELESAPLRGSTFRITLPLATGPAAAAATA